MRYALQWILSLLFIAQMYITIISIALLFTPAAFFTRRASFAWMRIYSNWVRFSARWMLGLHTEVRGPVPTGAALIASKHQSFLDSLLLFAILDTPRFIMKKELAWIPLMGWHAMRIGCVPVDRGRRGAAIKKMLADVDRGEQRPGQLVIYPQGTRVAPEAKLPYKVGTALIYSQLNQPCIPVATNVGFFWPRHGIYRRPGNAIIEFLEPIPPGMPLKAFMARLELEIETASDRLLAEAKAAATL